MSNLFDKWDIVVVPFPFTDIAQAKFRPALVLSQKAFNSKTEHTVFAMITTGAKTTWFNDVKINDLKKCGLEASSVIRYKIFTLDNRLIKNKIGKLAEKDQKGFKAAFKDCF